MKATAIAPANIAFIKYWGKKDETWRLPVNNSISMNLSNLTTTTTVEFAEKYAEDIVIIDGFLSLADSSNQMRERIVTHLNQVRELAGIDLPAKVVSQNSFPMETGLSSSASGFAALTVAAVKAAGLSLSKKELSILARLGSGSACRSIPDGFVEWHTGETSEDSYAESLYPPEHWQLIDLVAILSVKRKQISSTQGQRLAETSAFFNTRLERIEEKISQLKIYLKERNFPGFGELIEAEALELHAVMMTSRPPLLYWYPETVALMQAARSWREAGLPVYFTVNTGHNVHLICEKKDVDSLEEKVKKLDFVRQYIINQPAKGARTVKQHLF